MEQSAQIISIASRRATAARTVIPLPAVHSGYATARSVLRDPDMHSIEAIDAAFEVLACSPAECDRALCRRVADQIQADQLKSCDPYAESGADAPGVFLWIVIAWLVTCVAGLWIGDAIAGAARDAVRAPELVEAY